MSNDTDASTIDIIKWIDKLGGEYVRINRESSLKVKKYKIVNNAVELTLEIDGKVVSLDEIESFWYRRGEFVFSIPLDSTKIENTQLQTYISNHVNQELRYLRSSMHDVLTKLPSISDSRTADINKLEVLLAARALGIRIPGTLVTSEKKELLEFRREHKTIITKGIQDSPRFEFSVGEENMEFLTYTEVFDDAEEDIPDTFFPTLFQEGIDKSYELRIFYLHGKFYPMAIFSQLDKQTAVDFRKYNTKKPNRSTNYILPKTIETKLQKLMDNVNLNSGSIDIVVSKDDEFVFLEVNPIGQFGMVSIPCNYYIEKDIAKFLLNGQ